DRGSRGDCRLAGGDLVRPQPGPVLGLPGTRRGSHRRARGPDPPAIVGPLRGEAVRGRHSGPDRPGVPGGHGEVASGGRGQRRPDSRAGAGRGGATARPPGRPRRGQGRGPVKDSERGTPQPPGRTPAREARSVPGPADEMRHTAGTGAERRIRRAGRRYGVPGAEDQPPEASEAPQGRTPAREAGSVPGPADEVRHAAGTGAERRVRRPGRRYGVPGAEDQPPEASEAPQGRTPAREAIKNAGWRRLHPLSPLVPSGRAVLAVLALAGRSPSGLLGSGPGTRWWDLALVAVVAGGAVINWLVTRWKVDGVPLRIETGLLRRDSRQLPIARIQAVDLVRPFLARMLGLAELRVRLAGAGDADGRLAYLTEPGAEALRARLLAAHHGLDPAPPAPPPPPTRRKGWSPRCPRAGGPARRCCPPRCWPAWPSPRAR